MANRSVRLFFISLSLVYILLFFLFRWGDDPIYGWKGIIESDGRGYYSYLVHAFIQQDMQYTAHEHLYAVETDNGTFLNKFYYGTALLELPFFLLGYAFAWLFDYPLDGFSQPFALAIGMSSLFYSLLGLYFLFRVLQNVFGCTTTTALLVTAFAALGTNLVFYSIIYGSFSHSFSFFAITYFVYQLALLKENITRKRVIWVSLVAALIAVIRPINILAYLLIPVVCNNKSDFIGFIKRILQWKWIILMAVFFALPLLVQCWLWYLQTGDFLQWSYQQEGFYFSSPRLGDVLFGFRRGLFVYCPLLLISLAGLFYGFKTQKWQTGWLAGLFILFSYVTASWWHWTYGDTFGMRPFNDVLILFMVLLGVLLMNAARLRKIILSLCVFATVLNLVFSYQFARGITNISTMNRDKFFTLFMDVSVKSRGIFGGENDIPPYAPNGFETVHYFKEAYASQPEKLLRVDKNEWPGGTAFIYPAEKNHVRHFWLEISYKRKLETPGAMKDVLFVVHSTLPNTDSTVMYYAFRVKEFPHEKIGEWKTVKHRLWIPNSFGGNHSIQLYLWNRGKEKFELDDYEIHVQLPKW